MLINRIRIPKSNDLTGHFWYSDKQFLCTRRANIAVVGNDQEVVYTEMTSEPSPSGVWDDYIYVGYGKYSRHLL